MSDNVYPKLGAFSIIPAADLIDIDAACNVSSPARLGDGGNGKRAGNIVVRDDDGAYSLVFATGSAPADTWELADGSATYTPV